MKKIFYLILCANLFLLLGNAKGEKKEENSLSRIWYVSTTGNDSATGTINDPLRTIQKGINLSVNRDTVVVYPGIYMENIIFNGKSIVLCSRYLSTGDTNFISSTIIDGGDVNTVVKIINNEDSTLHLCGFTITNGKALYDGGGIIIISNNPKLSHLKIKRNRALSGGGAGLYSLYSSFKMENCIIDSNTAFGFGGGLYLDEGLGFPVIKGCLFTNNYADVGGGIFYESTPYLENCIFFNNTANTEGGGMCARNLNFSVLKNVLFIKNISYYAGACHIIGANPFFYNCTFAYNNSQSNIKTIGCADGFGMVKFTNCIFANNNVFDSNDYEIYAFYNYIYTIEINHSVFEKGTNSVRLPSTGTIIWGPGNLFCDPLFIDTLSYNPKLSDFSPCIGAGIMDSNILSYDLENNIRPNPAGSNPDIGAYENSLAFSTPPYAPILVSPLNYSTGVSLIPTLIWDTVLGATGYKVEISTDANLYNIIDSTTVTANQYTIPSGKLNPGVKYYWRTAGCNIYGVGKYSLVWNFLTLQNLTLNIKVHLEGFWNGTTQVPDTVKVYLANGSPPYEYADSSAVLLSTNGTGTCNFTKCPNGNYYIIVIHRNHLETWSRLTKTFTANVPVSYDFTSSHMQAYGFNMVYSNGAWCLFGGDINGDGFVDGADMAILDNDLYNYASGYIVTDINGDQFVDGADMAILDNNLYNYIGVVKPGTKDSERKSIIFKSGQERNKTIWDINENQKKVKNKNDLNTN